MATLIVVAVYVNQQQHNWTPAAKVEWKFDGGDDDNQDDDAMDVSLVPDTVATSSAKVEPVAVQQQEVATVNYVAPAAISSSARFLEEFQPSIQPLWTCSETQLNRHGTKVIFVHVYKTAGSTFRLLFGNYAKRCKFGITIVAHCSDLASKYMVNGTEWKNRDGSRCRHKGLTRKGRAIRQTLTRRELDQNVDIAIGHLPLGLHWGAKSSHKDAPAMNAAEKVQYICFFRSPMEKYVSGVIYANKQHKSYPATVDATVKKIKAFVTNEVKHGKYRESYAAYLLTPWDKDKKPVTAQDRTERILQNLVRYPTVIGIVEQMDSSLELILHVIDQGNEVTSLFQLASNSGNKGVVKNKSHGVDTKEVVAVLQEDAEFYAMLQQYLQYDATVYDFAVELHKRQHAWLVQEQTRRKMV